MAVVAGEEVKFPEAFMFLEGEAEQVSKCESLLVVCVDEEVGVDDASGGVSLMTACGVEVCRRIQCERACAQTSARRKSWPWIVAETLECRAQP